TVFRKAPYCRLSGLGCWNEPLGCRLHKLSSSEANWVIVTFPQTGLFRYLSQFMGLAIAARDHPDAAMWPFVQRCTFIIDFEMLRLILFAQLQECGIKGEMVRFER